MIARKVYVHLKPNCLVAFTQFMEKEILPWLRRQEGFLELLTMAAPDGLEIQILSFWDHTGKAEDYNALDYPPEVLKTLALLLDGITYGRTFEVVSSTIGTLPAPTLQHSDPLGQADTAVPGSPDCALSVSE
ncbi:MAG TPA: hypothetical protein VKV39_20610 [Candidatus Sulfotelmatobacter sp.]|nr:hypothetical protein [Candidatus Sulfotelmatobacter sp.]